MDPMQQRESDLDVTEGCLCAGWEPSEDDEDVCSCGHNYDMHTGSGECQAGWAHTDRQAEHDKR